MLSELVTEGAGRGQGRGPNPKQLAEGSLPTQLWGPDPAPFWKLPVPHPEMGPSTKVASAGQGQGELRGQMGLGQKPTKQP